MVKKTSRMRIAAQVDRATGVIHRTIRGANFIVDASEWDEVTDDPRALELFSTDGQKKMIQKNGKLKTKPHLKIVHDADEFEVVDGFSLVKFEVLDGDHEDIPQDIKVRINSKIINVHHKDALEIRSNVANRLTIKVEDDRVYVPDTRTVMAVPKGQLGKKKADSIVDDNSIQVSHNRGK